MNKTNVHKNPKLFQTFFTITMIAAILGVLLFVSLIILIVFCSDSIEPPVTLGLLIACAICITASFICNYIGKNLKRKFLVASGQFESVQDVINQEEKLAQEREEARAQQQKAEADRIYRAQHPQCPACHGNNTRRISTTKRVVSTSVVGLASSTIGKQYECLDCKHKW